MPFLCALTAASAHMGSLLHYIYIFPIQPFIHLTAHPPNIYLYFAICQALWQVLGTQYEQDGQVPYENH